MVKKNRLKADRDKTWSSEVWGQGEPEVKSQSGSGGVPLESPAVGTLLSESHFNTYHLAGGGEQTQSHKKSWFEKCSPKC